MRVTLLLLITLVKCAGRRCEASPATEMVCGRMPGLTARQREMCRAAPDAMLAVGTGYRMARSECFHHFAGSRWNCTPAFSKSTFNHIVVVGSREAAFTYGITSAGVAYAVAAGCSRGNITSCGCLPARLAAGRRSGERRAATWKWAGCSVDVGYGLTFARRFLDSREVEGDPRSLMNLHNNRAGRTMVKSRMTKECKCHGVSGSCTMRTCWRSLPPFRQVAESLVRRYRRARAVQPGPGSQLRTRKGRLVPRRADLVYLEPSPNYCEPDPLLGSIGTVGRPCNRSISGVGGCDTLCCGRGYNTHQVVRKWRCNCKFHWCCYVECDTCTERSQVFTCN